MPFYFYMLKIKGKVCVRVGEQEAKALMRKKKVLVHNSFLGNIKTAMLGQSRGLPSLRSCFKKGRKQTRGEESKCGHMTVLPKYASNLQMEDF